VRAPDGSLPLLAPMSEVAGRLAPQVGAYHLMANAGGRGVLMGGTPGVRPADVVVLGGGVAGQNATEIAVGMHADVTVLDLNPARLHEIDNRYRGQVRTVVSNSYELDRAVVGADTAGSAQQIAEDGDKSRAALASELAAETYGLEILARDIHDNSHNATRFLVMSRQKIEADPEEPDVLTTFVFQVRNVPAALYKAMGGFATNGVNMVKLESYMVNGSFTATQFYAEIEGHPDDRPGHLALDELGFFCKHLKVLGVYPASEYRKVAAKRA